MFATINPIRSDQMTAIGTAPGTLAGLIPESIDVVLVSVAGFGL